MKPMDADLPQQATKPQDFVAVATRTETKPKPETEARLQLEVGWSEITLPTENTIGIRPLTYREARAIASATPDRRVEVLRQVVKASTTIDPQKYPIPWPDLQFIMLWWRTNSMPVPEFELDYDCPHCGRQNNTLVIQPSEIAVDSPAFKESELVVVGGRQWTIGYPDAWAMVASFSEPEANDREELQFAAKIHQPGASPSQILSVVGDLPNKDAMILADRIGKFDGTHPQAIAESKQATCPSCNKPVSVGWDADVDFFFGRS